MLVKFPVPVYGVTPPLAVTVTVVFPPKQSIVPAVEDEVNRVGSVIVTDVDAVQPRVVPLASFTVTV